MVRWLRGSRIWRRPCLGLSGCRRTAPPCRPGWTTLRLSWKRSSAQETCLPISRRRSHGLTWVCLTVARSWSLYTECVLHECLSVGACWRSLSVRRAICRWVMENSAALQALVEGCEAQLEDQLFELNEDWERVHTLIEDWLSAVLVSDCLNLHDAVNSFRFTSSQQLIFYEWRWEFEIASAVIILPTVVM